MSASSSKPSGEMPLVEHLIELRNRLLQIILAVGAVLLVLMPFANPLFTHLSAPLRRFLPDGTQMIAIGVIDPFFIPFKFVLTLAVFITIPIIFYHLWKFIAPGLYAHEQKLVVPLLISSTLLFYLGMTFAYFVVFPLVFGFMVSVTPEGVTMSTDIGNYLGFVIKMFFAFGLAFEVPVATVLLVRTGLVTVEALAAKRAYIVVAAFIIGMLLTPPDVISQTLLAVPILVLFELGLWASAYFERPLEDVEPNSEEDYDYCPRTPEDMDAELTQLDAEEEARETKWKHD